MQKLVVGLAMDAKRDSKTVDKINRRLIAYFLFFFFNRSSNKSIPIETITVFHSLVFPSGGTSRG